MAEVTEGTSIDMVGWTPASARGSAKTSYVWGLSPLREMHTNGSSWRRLKGDGREGRPRVRHGDDGTVWLCCQWVEAEGRVRYRSDIGDIELLIEQSGNEGTWDGLAQLHVDVRKPLLEERRHVFG